MVKCIKLQNSQMTYRNNHDVDAYSSGKGWIYYGQKMQISTWCVRPVKRLILHSYAKSLVGHPQSSILWLSSIISFGQGTFLHSKTSSWHKTQPLMKSAYTTAQSLFILIRKYKTYSLCQENILFIIQLLWFTVEYKGSNCNYESTINEFGQRRNRVPSDTSRGAILTGRI